MTSWYKDVKPRQITRDSERRKNSHWILLLNNCKVLVWSYRNLKNHYYPEEAKSLW